MLFTNAPAYIYPIVFNRRGAAAYTCNECVPLSELDSFGDGDEWGSIAGPVYWQCSANDEVVSAFYHPVILT